MVLRWRWEMVSTIMAPTGMLGTVRAQTETYKAIIVETTVRVENAIVDSSKS